jgi:hypothetical protein
MHIEKLSQLGLRLVALHGGQRHLRLEGRRVVPASALRHLPVCLTRAKARRKEMVRFRRTYATPRSGVTAEGIGLYRASKLDCDVRKVKAQCSPNAVGRGHHHPTAREGDLGGLGKPKRGVQSPYSLEGGVGFFIALS